MVSPALVPNVRCFIDAVASAPFDAVSMSPRSALA
jgi:hypothetical protein